MALEDVVVGNELSAADFVWDEASQQFQIRLGAGMARDGSGVWSLDPSALAAAIAAAPAGSGLDAPTVQAMIDAAVTAGGGTDSSPRLTAHGFDAAAKTLTSTLADGTQVVAGLPEVFTTIELADRLKPLTSVSGRAVPGVFVLGS